MKHNFFSGLLLLTGLLLISTSWAQAQNLKKYKRMLLKRKLVCLQRCHNVAKRGFRRCYYSRYQYCAFLRGHKMRVCIMKCRFPGFCNGVRMTASTCYSRCWNNALKRRPKKYWSRRYRRWIKPRASVVRKYLLRERFACQNLCKSLQNMCMNVVTPQNNVWKRKPRPRDY